MSSKLETRVYELTSSAQEDLKEITRYSIAKWSNKQSLKYAELLEKRFHEFAARIAYCRNFSKRLGFTPYEVFRELSGTDAEKLVGYALIT